MLVSVLQPLQKCESGLDEIAQWSRALATLIMAQSSVSNSQIKWLTTDYSVSSRRSRTVYGFHGSCTHVHMPHTETDIHI